MGALKLVLKLGRLKMTVFSAVTYGTAASVANLALLEAGSPSEFDAGLFLAGWAFVFFTQLVAHFLGEYYDLPSDKLNYYAGPLTGGSKVLVSGDITPGQCFALGYACAAAAGGILALVLPRRCLATGLALMFIAHQYSAPPFKCNHRGLGELTASLASNVLLPQFAALVQSASFEEALAPGLFHASLAVLVVPAFFLKLSLFLALNMADRRPDWLGAKYTLPVILGDEACSRMLGAFNVLAYASAACIFLLGLCPATTLAAILLSAPEALSIARAFNPSLTPGQLTRGCSTSPSKQTGEAAAGDSGKQQRPYRLEGLVVRVLKHGPGIVLAVFADTVLREAMAAGSAAAAATAEDSGIEGVSYWGSWLSGTLGVALSPSLAVRCLPLLPFVYLFFLSTPGKPAPPSNTATSTTAQQLASSSAGGWSSESAAAAAGAKEKERAAGVVVAGGGVGGLVLGACLQELGLPFEILEKSPNGEDVGGADIALWPAATKVLKELGVGSAADSAAGDDGDDDFVDLADFWGRKTYPVRFVRICKVDKNGVKKQQQKPSSPAAAAPETVLTTVDMDAVVTGEGEPFRLVSRKAVMSALLPLINRGRLRRGVRVVKAEQSTPPGETTATVHIVPAAAAAAGGGGVGGSGGSNNSSAAERVECRVLVGADGIHSMCRVEVSAAAARLSSWGYNDGSRPASEAPAGVPPSPRAKGVRDGGEVCYRGVLDLRDGAPAAAAAGLRSVFEEDEEARPGSMSVVYGDRIRFSWGFIDGTGETGYWFVKQLTGTKHDRSGSGGEGDQKAGARGDARLLAKRWPEPLRTLAEMTGEECSYVHRIQDRPPIDRWSSGNITLLGDACHPATPNNGQGACMAIEDALVLATLLAEHWERPDGHVEAFYLYERARLTHTRRVQGESRKQMKLGQLTNPAGIWLRELVIGALPASFLQKKLRAANVFDIDPWLDRFRALKAERQRA
ncbi:Flavoprotein Monooxygenase [Ectocarpus siliculosus]|uniref:Flavoprotein Monooxygenase n=1 Tax=Ectocarpus siliculosus TaxID=2880 RepID=D7FH29_ECTSI|nr:Flavoprotein Monooxygenase [Ectocarpus siliculosus]|eukprot:CBJ28407.1 Flavoprotein Monooxygenase [Ectocarpus siliculosus]